MNYDKNVVKINQDYFRSLQLVDDFKAEVKSFRKNFHIKRRGFNNDRDIERWQEKIIAEDENNINLVTAEIDRILKKFKLSKNYSFSLRLFLLTGKISYVPCSNIGINFKDSLINIAIYKRPTKQEWAHIKEAVNFFIDLGSKGEFKLFKENNYPFGIKTSRQKRTLDRDIKVTKLKGSKKRFSEIEFIIFEDDDDTGFNIKKEDSKKNIQKLKTATHRRKRLH